MPTNDLKHRNIIPLIQKLTGGDSEIIIYGDLNDNMDEVQQQLTDNGISEHIQYQREPEHHKEIKVVKNNTTIMLRDAIHYAISLN